MSGREWVDRAALVLAVASSYLFIADVAGPPRQVAAIVFLLFVPGWSLIRNLRLGNPALEVSLAVGVSVALAVAIALTMLAAGKWSPLGAHLLLAGGSSAGLAVRRDVRRDRSLNTEEGGFV